MKANHYTSEQIIKILEQAERGEQTVGALCQRPRLATEHYIGPDRPYRCDFGIQSHSNAFSFSHAVPRLRD